MKEARQRHRDRCGRGGRRGSREGPLTCEWGGGRDGCCGGRVGRMHTYCNLRRLNDTITAPTIEIKGLKGLKGIVLFGFSMVRSGYLHTLRRSRRSRERSRAHLEGGEAEPDGNQRGGPGAAPGLPHRPAAPRAPSPRPDAHAAGSAHRQPAQPVAIDLK